MLDVRQPASWSSGNVFVSGARSLMFKSWAGQIRHKRVANGSPPQRHFFSRTCVARHNDAKMGPANSYYSEFNKDLIWTIMFRASHFPGFSECRENGKVFFFQNAGKRKSFFFRMPGKRKISPDPRKFRKNFQFFNVLKDCLHFDFAWPIPNLFIYQSAWQPTSFDALLVRIICVLFIFLNTVILRKIIASSFSFKKTVKGMHYVLTITRLKHVCRWWSVWPCDGVAAPMQQNILFFSILFANF